MKTILGIPNANRLDDVAALWRELKVTAVPFPFECSDDELEIRWEHSGCNFQSSEVAAATAIFFKGTNTARICLGEEFFRHSLDIQLAVRPHEVLHIRLFDGRLAKNFLVSQVVADRLVMGRNDDELHFAIVRQRVAEALVKLVAEIGVDKFMASHYKVSSDYWRKRRNNFYLDATSKVIHEQDITATLRPYAEFYRLVTAELGLLVVTNEEDRQALVNRRNAYLAALDRSSGDDEAVASWLKSWRTSYFPLIFLRRSRSRGLRRVVSASLGPRTANKMGVGCFDKRDGIDAKYRERRPCGNTNRRP